MITNALIPHLGFTSVLGSLQPSLYVSKRTRNYAIFLERLVWIEGHAAMILEG